MARGGLVGGAVGLTFMTAGAAYFTLVKLDTAGIEDRAFRLYHNRDMRLWDALADTGLVVGAVVGSTGRRGALLPYAALGCAAGSAVYMAVKCAQTLT